MSTLEQHAVKGEGGCRVSPPTTLVPAGPLCADEYRRDSGSTPRGPRLGRESADVGLSLETIPLVWVQRVGPRDGFPRCFPPFSGASSFVTHMTHCRRESPRGGASEGCRAAGRQSQILACKGSSWSLGPDFPNVPPFSALDATSPPPSLAR